VLGSSHKGGEGRGEDKICPAAFLDNSSLSGLFLSELSRKHARKQTFPTGEIFFGLKPKKNEDSGVALKLSSRVVSLSFPLLDSLFKQPTAIFSAMPSEATSPPLLTDLSLGLLVSTILLGVYLKYFSRPLPLVHPLLLGKQSEVSQTRNQGESGVYRSWATGHGSPVSLYTFCVGKFYLKKEGKTRRWRKKEGERELILERPRLLLLSRRKLSLRPANSLRTVANILDLSCPTRYIYGTFVSPVHSLSNERSSKLTHPSLFRSRTIS